MTSKQKIGMKDLANVVLDLKRDIKRMSKAMSPQGAAQLVNLHNQANPNNQWTLLKKNPQGPDTLDNMIDKNNDGVPDVIVVNKDNNPLIVNGYTTTQTNWAEDALYNSAFPDRASRAAYKRQHGKSINKRDFIDEIQGVRYFTYDDATRPEQLNQIGSVVAHNMQNLPAWYQSPPSGYRVKKVRAQSAFNQFKKYVFGPAFDDAIGQYEDASGTNLTGQQKMILHAKLCSRYWKQQIRRVLDPRNTLSEAEFEKLRKKKSSAPLILNQVRTMMAEFKNNANTHSYDNLVGLIVNDLHGILNTRPAINGANAQPDPHAPYDPGRYLVGTPTSFSDATPSNWTPIFTNPADAPADAPAELDYIPDDNDFLSD